MMKRQTIALLVYAGTGGGLMLLTAVAVGQVVSQQPSPTPNESAILSLLGPSASGIVGALVLAVYNQISGFVKTFGERMDRLESSNKRLRASLVSRPCMTGGSHCYQDNLLEDESEQTDTYPKHMAADRNS